MEGPLNVLLTVLQIVLGLLALLPLKPLWKLLFVPFVLALAGPYLLPVFEGLRTGNPTSEGVPELRLEHWPEAALAIWIAALATIQCHTLFVLLVEPLKDCVPLKRTVTAVLMGILFGASLYAYAFFYSARTSVPVDDVGLVALLGLLLAVGLPLGDAILSLLPKQGGLPRVVSTALALGVTGFAVVMLSGKALEGGIILVIADVQILPPDWALPQHEDWLTRMICTSAVTWVLLESVRFGFAAYYAAHPPEDSVLIAPPEERHICDVCEREFPTYRGLRIHQGKMHQG